MGKRKLTDEQEAEIVRLYVSGKSYDTIAKEIKIVSAVTVGIILKKNNIEIRALGRKGRRDLQEQYDKIIQLYLSGMGPKELSEQFKTAKTNINRILKIHNIERNHEEERYLFNKPKIVDYIVNEYIIGRNSVEIAKELHISDSAIIDILKRNKIKIRTKTESGRNFPLNKSWLDNIDSEDKAYFLGLMWTDGNIAKDGRNFRLAFKSDDKYILEYFSSIFYYGVNRIADYQYEKILPSGRKRIENKSLLRVSSVEMVKKLMSLGCLPNKTFKVCFPEWLNKNLLKHFIRGLIDGDGCIHVTNKKHSVSFIGTYELLNGFREILTQELNINFTIIKRNKLNNKNTYVCSIDSFENIKKLLDWIYQDSTIYFIRKKNKYLEFLKLYQEHINRANLAKDKKQNIYRLFISGNSTKQISELYGYSLDTIRRAIRELKQPILSF